MWQTRLGRCIYTSPSGYKVYENMLYRWLTLGSSALQTVINRRYPQKPVLHYLNALSLMARSFPNDVCLLGLGGGGILHQLASKIDYPLCVVDSSKEVIQIAQQYFYIDHIKKLEVIHLNAVDYLKQVHTDFTHLIIDLYDAHNFPDECKTDDFFKLCHQKLSENGFLSINLANVKEQWSIVQLIKKHFSSTVIFPIKKSANMVLIATKNEDKEWLINKIDQLDEVKKLFWVNSWGYVGQY